MSNEENNNKMSEEINIMSEEDKKEFLDDKEGNYDNDEYRYAQIILKYSEIGEVRVYSTLMRIAVDEYIKYLNTILLLDINIDLDIRNHGAKTNNTFAIKRNGKIVANEKFLQKCIDKARKFKGLTDFAFCDKNIVLDKFEKALSEIKNY